jgi:23S rRNA (cytidine2498-2'-O)-methyltransferase
MEKDDAKFIFVCCQAGAEPALKSEIDRKYADLRFAFSRPGFVTFKVPIGFDYTQPLRAVFARAQGVAIRTVTGSTAERIAATMASLPPTLPFQHLHVWNRDQILPGDHGFEPFHSPAALAAGKEIRDGSGDSSLRTAAINRTAKVDEWVADVIVIDSDTWFLGWHKGVTIASRWPGGVPPLQSRDDVVSRAFWKMEEALRWSQLPIRKGDTCVELGSSPGGSCQALLERGLLVVGIDPAKMDARLISHPNFTHVQARAADLKRKSFKGVRWLMADANIAPQDTLDSIEHIVTNRRVNISGMLITLKILDWGMAERIDDYLNRIRSWNFGYVRARQLAFNRREVCVVAVRRKQIIRQPRMKRGQRRASRHAQ